MANPLAPKKKPMKVKVIVKKKPMTPAIKIIQNKKRGSLMA